MMTVHVLHAGDGYSYLTRQVAAGDQTVRRGEDLTDYYTAEGNPPGVWLGSGLDALGVEGQVSEEQMRALFSEGLHPNAEGVIAELIGQGATPEQAVQGARLGRRFMVPQQADDTWNRDIAAAYADFKTAHDRAPEVGVERDLIRWNLATSRLQADLGRPAQDVEISGYLAKRGASPRQPVAGYDLVFTPVKSVSVLWALGDRDTSREVRLAHESAWKKTISWLEREAALTRVGAAGVGQVDTNGLVATAFEHRDSRTGDPNLHTHVAVSTKVQGKDGKWRSLDGRVLHALGVSASERYNSLIEQELRERLGVTFEDETRGRNKRAVREIVGIDRKLRDAFSTRRASIEEAYEQLLQEYVSSHGHTPGRSVQLALAQRATLATREAKSEAKSLDQQRTEWRALAVQLLGERRVDRLGERVRRPVEQDEQAAELAARSDDALAVDVLTRVENDRSTWRRSHVEAEALRVARTVANVRPGVDVEQLADTLTRTVLERTVPIAAPDANPVPAALQRADGASIYTIHGARLHTSPRILGIEDRLLAAAKHRAGFAVDPDSFTRTLDAQNALREHPLDASQAELARQFACGGSRIQVGIGPAGTGKTTAMRVFARAVEADGGRVLALAPTAVASTVLAEEIDVEAETAHKLVWVHKHGTHEQRTSAQYRIDERTVLLIDEAGMASTPLLADVLDLAEQYGASIRLLGDPAQLAAVEAGGALRLIERTVGASYLDQVHRFVSKEEAAATLLVREGRNAGLDFYLDQDRTRGGLRQTMLEEIYAAWALDRADGKQAIMVAGTNDEVSALNARARADLIASGTVRRGGTTLHDGNTAGVGDTVVTRLNDRKLRSNRGRDFVANGDMWTVLRVEPGGALKVKSLRHDGVLTLPADYVGKDVELGYAATINRVQGMTVDRSHILIDPEANTREQLYVAATRGRESNRMYVVVEDIIEADGHAPDHARSSILQGLHRVLGRQGAELSAHETITETHERAASLATLVPAYEDASERVLDPGQRDRLTAIINTALPAELADRILTDEAWGALATRLAAHESHGVDLASALRGVSATISLDGTDPIRSPAKVFHHRLGTPPSSAANRLPSWITPPPEPHGPNSPVRDWLRSHSTLNNDRINALVTDAIEEQPAWIRELPPAPLSGQGRADWRRDVGAIVAYRDLTGHTDPDDPIGPPPQHPDDAYAAALEALERFRKTSRPQPRAAERFAGIQPGTNRPDPSAPSPRRLGLPTAPRPRQDDPPAPEPRRNIQL
jgi:conjugative relaxase-like TrwC/TraI family protein